MTLFETGPRYVVSFRESFRRAGTKWYIGPATATGPSTESTRKNAFLYATRREAAAAANEARKSSTGYVFTVEEA